MDQILMLGKEAELSYYEEVKEIYLHPNLFSAENGLLSTGGKLKRQKLVKYFKPQLEDLYKHLDWDEITSLYYVNLSASQYLF